MKTAAATTLGAIFTLAFALAISADAAPKGNQANCPKGPPAVQEHRSATGQANACGPRQDRPQPRG